jgi:hypothetical protein
MEAYGIRRMAPHILNLAVEWSPSFPGHFTQSKEPPRPSESEVRSGRTAGHRVPNCPADSLVTIPTEISRPRLSYWYWQKLKSRSIKVGWPLNGILIIPNDHEMRQMVLQLKKGQTRVQTPTLIINNKIIIIIIIIIMHKKHKIKIRCYIHDSQDSC